MVPASMNPMPPHAISMQVVHHPLPPHEEIEEDPPAAVSSVPMGHMVDLGANPGGIVHAPAVDPEPSGPEKRPCYGCGEDFSEEGYDALNWKKKGAKAANRRCINCFNTTKRRRPSAGSDAPAASVTPHITDQSQVIEAELTEAEIEEYFANGGRFGGENDRISGVGDAEEQEQEEEEDNEQEEEAGAVTKAQDKPGTDNDGGGKLVDVGKEGGGEQEAGQGGAAESDVGERSALSEVEIEQYEVLISKGEPNDVGGGAQQQQLGEEILAASATATATAVVIDPSRGRPIAEGTLVSKPEPGKNNSGGVMKAKETCPFPGCNRFVSDNT